jgi:hypothetical protein
MARRWHWGPNILILGRTVAVISMAATLAPAAALGSFPGGDGVIAYGSGSGIWAVSPTTGYQLQLTSGPDTAPSFSPSGNMLAFERLGKDTFTVYLAQADGADARPLLGGGEPAFSPTGRQLVFVRRDGLFVTGLTPGSPVRQITKQPGDRSPRWSSTGAIVFERTDVLRQDKARAKIQNELDTIVPPSAKVHQILVYNERDNLYPEWSPNGRTLTVALCNGAVEEKTFKGSPALAIHPSCLQRVPAPRGRGVAEGGIGALAGSAFRPCPRFASVEQIAWQPVVAGTMRVPTVKCEGAPYTGPTVSPSFASRGAKVCVPGKHGHRKICHTVS